MSSQDDLILLGDTFRCNECPDDIILRTFYTEEDLLNHKFEQIDRGQGHLKCHHCDWEFHTAEGLREHYKKVWPSAIPTHRRRPQPALCLLLTTT